MIALLCENWTKKKYNKKLRPVLMNLSWWGLKTLSNISQSTFTMTYILVKSKINTFDIISISGRKYLVLYFITYSPVEWLLSGQTWNWNKHNRISSCDGSSMCLSDLPLRYEMIVKGEHWEKTIFQGWKDSGISPQDISPQTFKIQIFCTPTS